MYLIVPKYKAFDLNVYHVKCEDFHFENQKSNASRNQETTRADIVVRVVWLWLMAYTVKYLYINSPQSTFYIM